MGEVHYCIDDITKIITRSFFPEDYNPIVHAFVDFEKKHNLITKKMLVPLKMV